MIHRPIIQKIMVALNDIFVDRRPADKVVEFHLRAEKRFGSRDRKIFAENVYDIVRWWRRLREAGGEVWSDHEAAIQPERVESIVQNWLLFKQSDQQFLKQWSASHGRATRESIPDWLDAKGVYELGECWDQWLPLLNREAPIFLRVNTLVCDREHAVAALRDEGYDVQAVPRTDFAIELKTRANVFRSKCFERGFFEMQDVHSQQIVPFLQVEPGQRVIDACAGAGGKTLHLAAIMKNKGQILALDIHQRKLDELRRRARRAQTSSIDPRLIVNNKVIKRLAESADRVLLDVPCSGVGVLRRHPDSKWKMTEQSCQELLHVQRDILANYSNMVKPKGKLVYSTCSVFPSENQKQILDFLSNHNNFEVEDEITLAPTHGDGFYMARLSKK